MSSVENAVRAEHSDFRDMICEILQLDTILTLFVTACIEFEFYLVSSLSFNFKSRDGCFVPN